MAEVKKEIIEKIISVDKDVYCKKVLAKNRKEIMSKKEGKKNYNGKESTDRVKEITEKLEQGIQNLFDSDKYRLYLNTMSKLHHYSYSISLLIML